MKSRLLALWERVRTSFWFVPTLMAFAAAGLSAGTVQLDSGPIGTKLANSFGFLWSGGADGARSLLSTVASSMITVAGTVFSITIAALALASQQFGPRLLRNFTRDVGNQLVLGTFIATFLYCLLVLRTIRSHSEGDFVPYLSVTCGVLLAVASIGVLIYFIDHVSSAIQAESLIAVVGAELREDIGRLCRPASAAQDLAGPPLPSAAVGMCLIHAETGGYVQTLDRDGLLTAAAADDLCIAVLRRPGDFVYRGEALLRVWSSAGELSGERVEALCGAFRLGPRRTPTQDVRYGVRQLAEIATRALSPGVNDPFTAMGCIDWLADALAAMAGRGASSSVLRDDAGQPRLWEEPTSFAELARLSFDPLRAYGATSMMVTVHLLGAIARLIGQVDQEDARSALLDEAEQTATVARGALTTDSDRLRVEQAIGEARATHAMKNATPNTA